MGSDPYPSGLSMRTRSLVAVACVVTTLVAAVALTPDVPSLLAQGTAPVGLSGSVRSPEEGAMEGVLVLAKRAGSNKTVTVVTDAKGAYAFPRERLEPGKYDVAIRAIKYVLAKPAAVDVTADKPARLDLTLKPANVLELAHQLTDPEWMASYPLDEQTKW